MFRRQLRQITNGQIVLLVAVGSVSFGGTELLVVPLLVGFSSVGHFPARPAIGVTCVHAGGIGAGAGKLDVLSEHVEVWMGAVDHLAIGE
ncbi:MAG TPA: hypothetical protein PLR25_07915 [Planctomycetaceae bacterium]|nr:hypothetical protein [Planctomycetaceae bacterium]